jgi:glycosyltransferase involved in cell wall biosynthesis
MRKGLADADDRGPRSGSRRGKRAFRDRRPALFAETGSLGIRAAGTRRGRQTGLCEATSIFWASAATSNDLLNEFTLLVHPARQEPLGRVLLEAAAAGLPVVATDVGGTREIFPPETGTACLVPTDDSAALAAAIGGLLKAADRRAAIGRSARLRAEQTFDANRAAEGLARHYRELIASGRVSSGQPRAEHGWDTEEEGK